MVIPPFSSMQAGCLARTALAWRARLSLIGLLNNGVAGSLAPLETGRAGQRQIRGRLERDGRFKANGSSVPRIAGEREGVAVRERQVKRFEPT